LAQGIFSIASFGILLKQDEPSEGGIFANEIMLRKLLQMLKASFPIEVTELGIITESKLVQLENAELPIVVTEFGIVTESKLLQPLNVLLSIEVTELGIVIKFKLLQSANALLPIEVTELGIIIEVKLVQLRNAATPIVVTELGIVTFVSVPIYIHSEVFVLSVYTNPSSTNPLIDNAPHGLPVAVPL
jgi:hypothetical protein